jgi:putative transcriptional regulator
MVPSLLIVLVALFGAGDAPQLLWRTPSADWSRPAAHPLDPAKGRLLVADRRMSDPRFRESVILLLDHSATGSVGVIINRPTEIGLAELIAGIDATNAGDRPIFLGGPVEMNRLLFLVRDASAPQEAEHILGDIYAGGHLAELKRLLSSKSHDELRVFVGYAGWGPGQLDGEITAGGWYLMSSAADTIFSTSPETLWERFERKHGREILVRSPVDDAERVGTTRIARP